MLFNNYLFNYILIVLLLFSNILDARNNEKLSPNIVLVFVDDMGWGDFSCFGNKDVQTPNVDALSEEGIRFHNFYVNAPICSPSRVAISTGQYPQKWGITSYLAHRHENKERGLKNWLDPKAPQLARFLKKSGYKTGHFGKWHLGGQRDVDDAPLISAYGFDESLTNFEGIGAKLLPLIEKVLKNGQIEKGRIWEDATRLGNPVQWQLRCEITGGFVDRAITFINQSKEQNKPFYINLWPDDPHAPFYPSVKNWADTKTGLYRAVLKEMDQQLGSLFDHIKNDPKLRENTIILVCSDNGPEYKCGSGGPFKGLKSTLYEAGIRSPLVVWAPGLMRKEVLGTINRDSLFCAMDLVPTLMEISGIPSPKNIAFNGESMPEVLLGSSEASRSKAIFFRRPPDRKDFRNMKDLPDLAMRHEQWKFMCDYDGSRPFLFNLSDDPGETVNLAHERPQQVSSWTKAILNWNKSLPKDAGDPNFVD